MRNSSVHIYLITYGPHPLKVETCNSSERIGSFAYKYVEGNDISAFALG